MHEVYTQRLAERSGALAAAERRYNAVSALRVGVFLLLVACAWWGYRAGELAVYAVGPALAFVGLLAWHERVHRARRRWQMARAFYQRGLDRLSGAWVGKGPTGDVHVPAGHPYAFDVDAFGRGSLFELLAEARTVSGERTLASWLLRPAAAEEIRARQAAVRELTPELDLRERLALHAADTDDTLDLDALQQWAELPPRLTSAAVRIAVRVVTACSLAAAVAWLVFDARITYLLASGFVAAIIEQSLARQTRAVTARVSTSANELRALVHVISAFTTHAAKAPWLAERIAHFRGAAVALRRLLRRLDWYESRRNQLFAPIAYVLLWGPNFAFFFEDWRRAHGGEVATWLAAAGELEAIAALAREAAEHPDHCFAEIVDGPAQVAAEDVRHPLMHACVDNAVSITPPLRLLLISGSNMSGKSTLLRTLGLNVVLALMGGPVRARRFVLTPLQVAATLRVQDSLHEGASRFYAEIARLKVVADCASAGPTLFLLDEILSGTNSHDRRIGTEAVVRSLLERGAIGLVTTHDLALTEIVATLGDRAANTHFEDQMTGATLAFDYTMRPGVVKKSNAIALMRAVGLDV